MKPEQQVACWKVLSIWFGVSYLAGRWALARATPSSGSTHFKTDF